MKKLTSVFLLLTMLVTLAACGSAPAAETKPAETAAPTAAPTEAPAETTAPAAEKSGAAGNVPEDGVYSVDFETDSSMFHINESLNGKGTLTVENGQMTVHITLVSKSILNLYPGTAEEAKKDTDHWLQPTEDEVTYSDGYKETVYGFDVPVEELGVEFPLALIGKKGTWYDHTVIASNPEPVA